MSTASWPAAWKACRGCDAMTNQDTAEYSPRSRAAGTLVDRRPVTWAPALCPSFWRDAVGQDSGLRLLVGRQDLRRTRLAPDADAPTARALSPGEVRLAVDRFALTANNITYAAFGEAMKYWQFFPTDDTAWGCIPVWGFARVCESRAEGVEVGRRVWGYLPMGSYLVVRPGRLTQRGFVDASTHRMELPIIYNQLTFCDADPGYRADREAQQALLRPLFITSFLIDDFLAEGDHFGARQVLLSSASSKTAYGTAFCLARRRGTAGATKVVGLTSAGNLDFTRSLNCYDEVLDYASLPSLSMAVPTVYVDFSGDVGLRRDIHDHFNDRLTYSCSVGGTHWDRLGSGAGLRGPKPILFFAPAQYRKRAAPPPEGLGPEDLQRRIDEAWAALMERVCDPSRPWLEVEHRSGAEAVEVSYRLLLDGRANPRSGLMLEI